MAVMFAGNNGPENSWLIISLIPGLRVLGGR